MQFSLVKTLLALAGLALVVVGITALMPSSTPSDTVTPEGEDVANTSTDTMAITIAPCDYIAGRTFISVGEYEGGNTPTGPTPLGQWRVSFDNANKFSWIHSDIAESGTYTCADGSIIAKGYNIEYLGMFDSES